MRKPPAGLPEKLEQILEPVKINNEINEVLEKIIVNGGVSSRRAKDSEDELENRKEELKRLGWSSAEIQGEAKNPANASLAQVMRPGCKLGEITEDYAIIIMSTGAEIKHARRPVRFAVKDTIKQSDDD